MRCLVLAHEHKRLLRVTIFYPLQCLVRNDVRGVTGMFHLLAVGFEHRVVILTLPLEYFVMIKTGWFGLQMPFPDNGRLVTGFAEQLGKSDL